MDLQRRNNMDERKTRLMARNILKQQTPEVESQKKKKAKGAQEEPVKEDKAKKRSGKSDDAQREPADGSAEHPSAPTRGDRDLPSLAGELKRKRAPRGAARNVRQKTEVDAEPDPKTPEPAEATGQEDGADEDAIGQPADDGEKEITFGAAETPDGGMSRRESLRLRMKPVKFREIVPTLGAKLKTTEDGKPKSLEAQLPVEVQAVAEGYITFSRDRISDVYRRRDKKKPVPPKIYNLPADVQKEVKPPNPETKDAKSPTAGEKVAEAPAEDAKIAAVDEEGEKNKAIPSKDAKSPPGDKKEVRAAAVEEKEARTPTQEKEAKTDVEEKKDGKAPAKPPARDCKQPAVERKDPKTPTVDKKEGRPPPVERKDTRSSAAEKKGGKSDGSERRDGKSVVSERKDGQSKIAIKVKPPVKAAEPTMVDVPLKDSDENGLKAALQVVKRVMKLKEAEPFNAPVNPVALHIPDYFDVIKDPMDLGTIRESLEKGRKYQNTEDVLRDVHLVWSNCRKYNNDTDPVVELMQTVETAFIKHWTTAGLQYVPPKKLAAKALLGYTVSGGEKLGKSDQYAQKQSKGQADPKLQSDQQQAERLSSDMKVRSDKKVVSSKEPVEESRPLRQKKSSRAVHFEAVAPLKSKKRSAPVEQVMTESLDKEQKASSRKVGEQGVSEDRHLEPEVTVDEDREQSVVLKKPVKTSLANKSSEQEGVVDDIVSLKSKSSRRAARAEARLAKRQKTGKEPGSPGRREEEKQGSFEHEDVEIAASAAGKDNTADLLQVTEANAVDVSSHEVPTQEHVNASKDGEDGMGQPVASSSVSKVADEEDADVGKVEEACPVPTAADKDEDVGEVLVDAADRENPDQSPGEEVISISTANGQTNNNSSAADDETLVGFNDGKVEGVTSEEVGVVVDDHEINDKTKHNAADEQVAVADEQAAVGTSAAIRAADDETIAPLEEQNVVNVIPGDGTAEDVHVEGGGVKTPVPADDKKEAKVSISTDEGAVAEPVAGSGTEPPTVINTEKSKEMEQEFPPEVHSHAQSIPLTSDDKSKSENVGLKIKGERSSSKRREEKSNRKGKEHRSHGSEKKMDARSHSSSKGKEDRKSHGSRDRVADGQKVKEKEKGADESTPDGKEGVSEAVVLRSRDVRSSLEDANVHPDTAKSGVTRKDDTKKGEKHSYSRRDDKPMAPKKDDRSAPSRKDDKSTPSKKDDSSAPPKKDDKSKRINGTQHHREDCPCVVCKGRRRKLAGIANAERKEKRKLLALQEGGNKKSKLPMREQRQLVEASQKDGRALVSNEEIDGWEADDHFGELFDVESSDPSEAENVRFYPASFKVPPRKLSPLVYSMSSTLFGSNPASLWSKRPLLHFRSPQAEKSPLFLEICSLSGCKAA